ncbi:TIGR03759 family integrating conjugative element protein [Salmonella enterica subsp. enterica]|nr:TIGR03759 family integrating conjugative element protein [Salmonella enterica subsp. enterica]MIF51107.1 TIGR03759 family integrating conjugative element protein [Salmonella enterica subsp. enterica]
MRYFPVILLLCIPVWSYAAEEMTTPTEQSSAKALETEAQAQHWGLSREEWSRYEALKQGERGIWSPGLDPLTTLGVEATTDAERRKYADLLVEKEFTRVENELAFQRAYDAAWKRRFPDLMPVAASDAFPASSDISRLAVFVREDCSPCDSRLKSLLRSAHPLDIYLVDSGNDDARLRRWAVMQQIDLSRVKKREVTLNHDGGLWLQTGQGKMPAVLEKRGEQWHIVTAP